MKKIILATTALVSVAFAGNALAQESQMMSAMGNDIQIGGYYEFGYSEYSDDDDASRTGDGSRFYGDSELFINFSAVSDAGLEYGVSVELPINGGGQGDDLSLGHETADDDASDDTDEASIYIAGDFGRVILGNNDHAGDSFQTWIGTDRTYGQDDAKGPTFRDVEGNNSATEGDWNVAVKPHTVNAPYGDGSKITYLSPSFSGFQFGVSLEDDGVSDDDTTSVGAKYDFTLYGVDVTLKAAGYSYGNDDSSTSYGATFGYGDFTFTAASAEFDIDHDDNDDRLIPDGSGGTMTNPNPMSPNAEPEVLGFGLSYDINEDLFVSAYYATSEDDVTKQELSTTSVGARYTIAHGLTATAALNSFELEGRPGSNNTPFAGNNEGEELVLQVEFSF